MEMKNKQIGNENINQQGNNNICHQINLVVNIFGIQDEEKIIKLIQELKKSFPDSIMNFKNLDKE